MVLRNRYQDSQLMINIFLFSFSILCWVFSSMRGEEAKEVCPQIHLVQVPVARGKADLNGYRNAGSEVYGI